MGVIRPTQRGEALVPSVFRRLPWFLRYPQKRHWFLEFLIPFYQPRPRPRLRLNLF
jgi:hypothetical protein